MNMPILLKPFKSRAAPKNSFWQNMRYFFLGPTASGKTVNKRTSMATLTVYAYARALFETIAFLPLHVYWRTGQGKERPMDYGLYYLLNDELNSKMT